MPYGLIGRGTKALGDRLSPISPEPKRSILFYPIISSLRLLLNSNLRGLGWNAWVFAGLALLLHFRGPL
jgi:hypothetical protein